MTSKLSMMLFQLYLVGRKEEDEVYEAIRFFWGDEEKFRQNKTNLFIFRR